MPQKPTAEFEALISDRDNWPKFMELLDAAARIVGDFDDWGEVIQSNEDGEFDRSTNIEQLRGALLSIDPDIVQIGDYYPHLSDEQVAKIREVAIEVTMAGDGGENKATREEAEEEIRGLPVAELLDQTGWFDGRCLEERFGFNPETGKSV